VNRLGFYDIDSGAACAFSSPSRKKHLNATTGELYRSAEDVTALIANLRHLDNGLEFPGRVRELSIPTRMTS
jgi:hypothetical protein